MIAERFSLAGTMLRERTADALADERLRGSLARAFDHHLATHRSDAMAELSGPDALRHAARGVRNDILADLPELLERFADRALARGTHVCWASTGAEARDYISRVVATHGATKVVRAKSMATEEIDLDATLAASGTDVVETDLGLWVGRLADEVPGHIVDPAPHPDRGRQQIHDLLVEKAQTRPSPGRRPHELVRFAQERLREQFLGAGVGITGANLAVADTGSIVLVTNEGNGRLITSLPPVHVVVLGMERLTASWDQADLLLALLARSATGQRLPSSTTVLTGPRATHELDGPEELHVVVLDNGRSRLLADPGVVGILESVEEYLVNRHAHADAPLPLLAGELADVSTSSGPWVGADPTDPAALPLRSDRVGPATGGERAAWRLWATAWSDARRYSATTRAATWGRWVTRLAGRLPVASSWAPVRELPPVAPERFRDRWWKGTV
ncbi:MAG TPA: LUD domain-containing protein [Acidimicrobiales bacterium]|nr:LUD domain-containing protein [Acidimicrobiales bacterium]